MKKLTIIALSAALTLALVVACGGGETTTENAPVAPAGSEPATSADPDAPTIDGEDTVSVEASAPTTGNENGNGILSNLAVGLDGESPPPTNPPDVEPPTVIGGNEVADRASGGSFEGPANSSITLPPGAVPSEIGFVGVALVELDAPPAPQDLPPELGEFIEGALILDVTFQTQRGVEVSILENAATVCLPVNEFILAAVGGDSNRLQIVRYHLGSWGALESEYRANEGVICAESEVFSEFALTALPVAQVETPGGDAGVGLPGDLPQTGGGLLVFGPDQIPNVIELKAVSDENKIEVVGIGFSFGEAVTLSIQNRRGQSLTLSSATADFSGAVYFGGNINLPDGIDVDRSGKPLPYIVFARGSSGTEFSGLLLVTDKIAD